MFLHACVFREYMALTSLVDVWASKSATFAVVQHEADGQTKRIHCHFLIEPLVGENALRESLKKIIPDLAKEDYWIMTKTKKTRLPYGKAELLQYMAKGKYAFQSLKNVSDLEVETARNSWVESSLDTSKPSSDSLDEIEHATYKHFEQHYEAMLVDDQGHQQFLRAIRTFVFGYLYRKTRKVPHASQYKQVVGSVYLRLMDTYAKSNPKAYSRSPTTAQNILMDLWY